MIRLRLALLILIVPCLFTKGLIAQDGGFELTLKPDLGSKYILHRTDYLAPDSEGDSLIWDYSGLIIGSSDGIRVVDSSQTIFKASFPSANICYDYGGGDYIYAEQDGLSYKRHGGVVSGIILPLEDDATLFELPLHIGNRTADDFSGSYTVKSLEIERIGTVSSEVITQGLILLPGQVPQACHLVEVLESFDDRFEIAGQMHKLNTNRLSHFFITDGIEEPLLTMIHQQQEDEVAIEYGVLYESPAHTEMRTQHSAGGLDALLVSPNPTVGLIRIKYSSKVDGNLEIDITDIQGKSVLPQTSLKVTKGPVETELDLKSLSPGQYLMHLQVGEYLRVVMVAKE